MNCRQIQRLLSVPDTSSPAANVKSQQQVEQHLEHCADCTEFAAKTKRLELQVASWAAHIPSSTLETRIAAALNAENRLQQDTRSSCFSRLRSSLNRLRENRTMVRRFAWGAASVLAITILAAGQQSGRAVTPLKRMGESAKKIRSVHLIGWNCQLAAATAEEVKNGNTQISVTAVLPHRFEAWISDGRWREAQDFDVSLYQNGRVWKNGALIPGETRPPLMTAFAFSAITGESPFGKGVEFTTEVLENTVLRGGTTTKLVLESKKKPLRHGAEPIQERRLFWLDPQTYLPIRMEEMRYDVDRWALDAVIWFDYDQPAPEALFDPAKVKTERHGSVDYTKPSAQDLYRMTDAQYKKYGEILGESGAEQTRINSDADTTKEQKDELLVQAGKGSQDRLRQIMNPDQQRLFDDWWYVQPKIMEKLATPEQRRTEAKWRVQQQALMDSWFASLDEETQKRLGRPMLTGSGH